MAIDRKKAAFDSRYRTAVSRGRRTQRRAASASYDTSTGRIAIELSNGALFAFPPSLVQGLHAATPEALSEVEIYGAGTALHWAQLDVDFELSALLAGVFGTRAWMRELGRIGGSVSSDVKARAARANGRKGRPAARSWQRLKRANRGPPVGGAYPPLPLTIRTDRPTTDPEPPRVKRLLRLSIIASLVLCGACASAAPATPPPAAAAEPTPAAHQHEAAARHEHQAGQHHLPATPGQGYTVADVRFMQHMIGHHAQALVMTAMATTHGAGDRLLRLAEKIDISQRDEIALMEQWLTAREQAVPDDSYMNHMMMPGMLSPEQLAQLDAARGREFERLFLTFMIRHHEGALQMVEELFDAPGAGQDPDIFRFATDVDADQRDEIYAMRTMLDSLDDNPGSPAR